MDRAAAASFEATFGPDVVRATPIERWLESEDVPDSVDLIVGGPPCQGFSTLGKQDVEDERNALWRSYAETITRTKPKYFVVENVAAFAKSPQYSEFVAETSPGGLLSEYSFEFRILNAADFGAFQSRKRTVIIGHHRDLPHPGFPLPTHAGHHRSVREAFAGLPIQTNAFADLAERTTYFDGVSLSGSYSPVELHIDREYSEKSLRRFAAIPPGGNRFDLPDDLLAPCWRKHQSGSGDVMGRLHWDKPSVTIRTEFFKPEKGRYLHPEAMRAITHYEACLLQGFGPETRFVGSRTAIARQIGNAVPIPLGEAIGSHLAPLL